ncbi:transposase domain-containing protein [Pendulispora rubella]|uniref:Transposase domain-containing protein n=1 Tax=Pendulispora rubella TaxID=2741070 RepID=A0ABZ2LDG1_9BACT
MTLFSLIATCERHDINPEVYLADILIRLQEHPKDRVAELLPHRWKERFGSGFTVRTTLMPSDAT